MKENINIPPEGIRKSSEAHRVLAEAYPYQCCVVCGLQLESALETAHLDHNPGNNNADNLAKFCSTHHKMFDCGLYPVEAVKLLRAHWQKTKGKPDHKARMKSAGAKAALTRKRTAAARKAWATRLRSNGHQVTSPEDPIPG